MAVSAAAGVARPRRWPGVLAWGLWALVLFGLAAGFWLEALLRRAGRSDPLDTAVGPTLAIVSAATVGAVLAGRRPATRSAGCCWPCRRRAPRSDAMPAWDLVLRPVKDVSVLYALGMTAPDARAAELQRPAWLRELGEPPPTVKGQRAWRRTVSRVEQCRQRYGITDPQQALGPEPRGGDLEQRRHHRVAQQVIERFQARQRTERQQRLHRRERERADQPLARPTRADRARPLRTDERPPGGREREAG